MKAVLSADEISELTGHHPNRRNDYGFRTDTFVYNGEMFWRWPTDEDQFISNSLLGPIVDFHREADELMAEALTSGMEALCTSPT